MHSCSFIRGFEAKGCCVQVVVVGASSSMHSRIRIVYSAIKNNQNKYGSGKEPESKTKKEDSKATPCESLYALVSRQKSDGGQQTHTKPENHLLTRLGLSSCPSFLQQVQFSNLASTLPSSQSFSFKGALHLLSLIFTFSCCDCPQACCC